MATSTSADPPLAPWQFLAREAQSRLLASIPAEWLVPADRLPPASQKNVLDFPAQSGLLSAEELAITESYAFEIVAKVAKGEWTAESVTTAFCKRAVVAHQLTNCLTVTMFPSALARAKELDAHFARTGSVVGPLHGLPISLKDNFNIPGFPSSVGFCAWALEPLEHESLLVGLLRSLGAVAYVKTNVPTAMMIAETVNNSHGRTLNPWNRALTSGGSSGGEAALLALRGSPLGVGTDIGGSLRIPAACTGLFTLKPSFGRLPHSDARSGLAGQEAVASVHGPLARSLSDCELYTRAVLDAEPWLRDAKTLPLPWRPALSHSLNHKPLRIGLLEHNGLITPTPPVQRALRTVAAALRAQGHDVVPWAPALHGEAMGLLGRFFTADGGKAVASILAAAGGGGGGGGEPEPWRPEMQPYADAEEIGVYQLWGLQVQRSALQRAYLERWNAAGLDVILSPTTPYVAPKHGQFRSVTYTGVFNILDYAAVSFPSGIRADRELDGRYPEGQEPLDEADARGMREFEVEEVHGLPVSLQIVGRRLEEEKVLGVVGRVLEAVAASGEGAS